MLSSVKTRGPEQLSPGATTAHGKSKGRDQVESLLSASMRSRKSRTFVLVSIPESLVSLGGFDGVGRAMTQVVVLIMLQEGFDNA